MLTIGIEYGLFPEVNAGELTTPREHMLRPLIHEVPSQMRETDNIPGHGNE
jgi:hypothetical protein